MGYIGWKLEVLFDLTVNSGMAAAVFASNQTHSFSCGKTRTSMLSLHMRKHRMRLKNLCILNEVKDTEGVILSMSEKKEQTSFKPYVSPRRYDSIRIHTCCGHFHGGDARDPEKGFRA